MTNHKQTQTIAYASILVAFGIIIPMMMPIKVIIGPASFTLASHVPIFLATFISLPVAIFVSLGTALGFFMAGFPIVIVFRALSHILFAIIAATLLRKQSSLLENPIKAFPFAFGINVIHAAAEFAVVLLLTKTASTDSSYIWTILSLVGLGTLIHGIVDFYLSFWLWDIMVHKLNLKIAKQ
ncbi:hypothetical protein [Streptococcus uberis]|uniref:hypothetical protein n=1 Tax=Streptococcus uberis TaxID=1349 RepID=UPI001FF53EF2|nr:hypothetical protein [Streptococcus uberis]MCK1222123.1 hypothetical protein [Streptococcus uberis]MCK1246216.1 hypothetical protein [Streptococcus uberis]